MPCTCMAYAVWDWERRRREGIAHRESKRSTEKVVLYIPFSGIAGHRTYTLHSVNLYTITHTTHYTVKKVSRFPFPSRDITNQTLRAREYLNNSRPGRVWFMTPRLGTGKRLTFFNSVAVYLGFLCSCSNLLLILPFRLS